MYKLVKEEQGKYISYLSISNPYFLEYKINEFVYPKIGKLFVFGSLKEALDFLNLETYFSNKANYKIFKCEVLGEPQKPKSISAHMYDLEGFWKELEHNNYPMWSRHPPSGTLLVDAVKLVEECNEIL